MMLRFARTHVRWAGIVLEVVGIALSNMIVFWAGVVIFAFSYLWAHSIMEEMYLSIEDAANGTKEEDNDDSTKE